jgi:hypothetical protein
VDDRPTFVLGLGCMKGGTTWLHDYLAASPACAPGYRKEYHVFDSVDVPELAWMRDRIVHRAQESLTALQEGRDADATFLHQAGMIADPGLYPGYFDSLVRAKPGARFTLDMTPNYGLLGAHRLAWVRDAFAAIGVRTVGLLLLRDPVERIWSQIRMQQRRRPGHHEGASPDLVAERYAEPHYAERTRYERTLDRMDEVLGPADQYVGFYERLFDPAELARICAVVGIDAHPADLESRRNASPKTGTELPEETEREVAQHFAETYRAVARRFPYVDLGELWPSSRFVL